MNLAGWIPAHRRSILFFLAVLAVAGVIAAFRLPVTLFPGAEFPRVVVSLDAGDRPADMMVLQVTTPVEEAIRLVPGVNKVRSNTSRGAADISINFDWGTDMALAAAQIDGAVTRILPSLPAGTRLQVRRMDPTVFPILAYSITSKRLSATELYDLAQYQLRPLLSSVGGVARVQVLGGAPEEYRVSVNPERLHAYGLTLTDVSPALGTANILNAVGRLEDHYKLFLVLADARFKDTAGILDTVLGTGANGVVRLRDVATVEDGVVPQWIRVTADGQNAVLINIYQQPGSNSVRISEDVKARLEAYRGQIPKGVALASWYDQSALVVASAASVRDAILIGIALGGIVLLVFLRNLKVTLIALVVVPTVLAGTVVLLGVLGMSFNIMTLGGMAAAVGLIIDDAIVMIEHIVSRLRAEGAIARNRIGEFAREFLRPLAGSSAATLVIFVPLAFLTGVTGAFFKALSLTMAAGLLISFLVTWLAVPILAEQLFRERDLGIEDGGRFSRAFDRAYDFLMRRALTHRILTLLFVVPLLLAGWVAYQHVGSGFMPAMDEGGFVLDYRAAAGTSLTETDRLVRQVESILRATPEVQTYSRRTGTGLGGGVTESNEGDFFVRLKPPPRRPIDEIMNDVRRQVESKVPGLEIELAQLMEDLIGDLTAVPQPIEIKLFSDDVAQLLPLAERIDAQLGKIAGVVDIKSGVRPAGDALEIHIDPLKSALEGVTPDAVSTALQAYLSGTVATEIQRAVKMVGVRVWIPQHWRATDSQIGELMLRAPDNHVFPVKRVSTVSSVSGQPQIVRENLKRMVAVTARISGRDLGSVVRDVRDLLERPGMLPAGIYYALGGLYEQQQIAFKGLLAVFGAAVALVFFLLIFLYERFRIALAIMSIPLMSVAAVFVGLWVTGIELNISAMMGMTMIVGIVTEAAIFYFSAYYEFEPGMGRIEALIQAGKKRARPIAMTTLAAILTLLPLALAIGEGSAMQQPLAVAIIAGLTLQLPLVLIVMPAVFSVLDRRQ